MRWSVIAILTVITLMLASPVSAAFSTVFSTIDNTILPNETAKFELTINNFAQNKDRFQVYTIDPNWIVDIEPRPISVEPDSSKTFTITVKPKSTTSIGSQGVQINVKNIETGDVIKETLIVGVRSFDSNLGTFAASIFFDVALPPTIDPRESVQLMVRLRNRNALDINGLTLNLKGPHFVKEVPLDLGPLGEITEYYSFSLDPYVAPGTYTLEGVISYQGNKVSEIKKDYVIKSYSSIKEKESKKNLFLKSITTIEVHNDGNEVATTKINKNFGFIKRLFSSTTPKANYQDGYVWEVVVGPNDSVDLIISSNYRYFTGLIVIIFLAILAYYFYRSPLLAFKEVVGVIKAEGSSDVKVRLFVKNRSNKVIHGVELIDKVPSIAELKSTHTLGTLQPTRVTKLKSGVLLRYDLDILEPYEERVITYSIKSKLKIVGRMGLPQAKVVFKTKSGQERVAFSNNFQSEK